MGGRFCFPETRCVRRAVPDAIIMVPLWGVRNYAPWLKSRVY